MSTSPACLATYAADARRYDELLDEKGSVRTHWRPLIERVAAGDGTGAGRRSLELTRRLIIENGVTYNVYADPQGADRPWGLDPLPLVLTASEWAEIETGLAQRAQLLNALLAGSVRPAAAARRRRGAAGVAVRSSEFSVALSWRHASQAATGCTSTQRIWRARRTAAGGC